MLHIAHHGVFNTGVVQIKRLGIEDVNEDTSSGRRIGLPHDVFDVLFHSLFSDLKRVCNFFVGPSLCQVLNNGLFPTGQLELFPGLISIELLPPR